ncbi:extracellular solute-binding protein [Paenibacillus caui]|uniref:extracellular solute-binding protein n=1 Tax=Paenibacillus caui TaxID=2873927 RepID=UPI001CA8C346|nr:extracellular solute-binding protein [Paenibacillus caui]
MEEDLKKAYETLGLKEGASREEVDKRFDLLIRQSRSRGRSPDQQAGFENINRAYRQIIEYEHTLLIEKKRQEHYGKWGTLAGPVEKMDDFLRIHKIKIIVSVIALILIITGITMFVNHQKEKERLAKLPPVDLSVMFIGDFSLPDRSQANAELEKALLASFPEWKRVSVKVTYLPSDISQSGQMGIALQQKAQLELMTEKPDLYMMDKSTFAWLAKGEALQNLDSLAEGELKSVLPQAAALQEKTEKEPSSHIYGIDLTNSSLAKNLPVAKTDMIAGIRIGNNVSDQTLLFLKRYLEAGVRQ